MKRENQRPGARREKAERAAGTETQLVRKFAKSMLGCPRKNKRFLQEAETKGKRGMGE